MRQQDSDLYAGLPADGEQAFLILETFYREEAEVAINNANEEVNRDVFYVDYIAKVLAAMSELGLDANFTGEVPDIENVSYQTYLNFSKDVRHYCTRLEIRHARRVQGYSVRFDTVAREKIHHFLKQVREIVERLEIGQDKRSPVQEDQCP